MTDGVNAHHRIMVKEEYTIKAWCPYGRNDPQLIADLSQTKCRNDP